MTKRILFASNGAEPARNAGVLLRRTVDSRLAEITVNVCDSVEFAFPREPWNYVGERMARPQPVEVASAELDNFHAAGFQADVHLGSGMPAAQILDKIRDGGYDLGVMGAGSSRWLDNYLLGSTSTRVLNGSPVSVLIVHRFEDLPRPVKLLVAVDGSPDADLAVDEVSALADRAKVSVTVVSVSDEVPKIRRLLPEGLSPPEAVEHLRASAQRVADSAAGRLKEAGFEVRAECRSGEPIKEILEMSRDADLVVCGSRGMGGAGRLLLGSVSDQLARLSAATLVCRSPH